MKTRNSLKHFLVIICSLALFVSIVPSSAFAADVDLEAIYRQIAEAQAQVEAQARQAQEAYVAAQAQAQQMLEAAQQFDVEAAFKYLSSLKTGEEKEAFFNSLTEIQQKLLVEYVKKLIEEDKFHGFDDFDFPSDLLPVSEENSVEEEATVEAEPEAAIETEAEAVPVEEKSSDSELPAENDPKGEEKTEKSSEAKKGFFGGFIDFLFGKPSSEDPVIEETTVEPVEASTDEATVESAEVTEEPVEPPLDEVIEEPTEAEVRVLTEEQMFYNDYEHYINLYREFGSYADLSGVSYDVQQRIKALVDAPSAVEEITEDVDTVILAETETEPVAEEMSSLPEDGSEEASEAEETDETPPVEAAELSIEEAVAEEEEIAANPDSSLIPDSFPQTPVSVSISSSRTDTMALGEPVVLTAVLDDVAEYTDIIYVWEVDKGTGTFESVPNANGPTYTFPASVDTLRWNWRLTVLYK